MTFLLLTGAALGLDAATVAALTSRSRLEDKPARAQESGVEGAIHCASCGHDNREEARFCDRCGAALARVCPSCRTCYAPLRDDWG